MKNIIPSLLLTTVLAGCVLPPAPMWKNKPVTLETSDKTITIHQKFTRSGEGRYIQVPAGDYKHVATDKTHFYFESPTPLIYAVKQGENLDSKEIPGGIAISKSMMKPCYIYMDLDSKTKVWNWMLGMEFIGEEGDEWWQRNYKPSLL